MAATTYLAELALELALGRGLDGLGGQFGITLASGRPAVAVLLADKSPAAHHCAYD